MEIALVALGSRGDIQPYVALGLGLQAAGHAVRLVSARNEAAFVTGHGLRFCGLEVDIRQLMDRGLVGETRGSNNPLRFFWRTLRPPEEVKKLQLAVQAQIAAACHGAEVLLYHPGQGLPFFLAQATGQVAVLASPFPVVPTADYPAILFYRGWALGRRGNRFTHHVFDRMFWAFSRPDLRQYWQSQQAANPPDFSVSVLRQQLQSGQPVLLGYSPRLFPPDPAWKDSVCVTGAWTLPADPNFQPSSALSAFLSAGEPPLYIGFGSMRSDGAGFRDLLALVGEALRRTGQRAVLGLGWSQADAATNVPPAIYLSADIPHSWLFARVKAVVHHGGAGTVHAGLAAGVPTVVVPHQADQPGWGQRLYELGVGSKPIPREKLSANNLAAAIQAALDPTAVARAKALGAQIRQENGVQRAVEALEAYVNKVRASS